VKAFAIYVRNISLLLCGGLILSLYISIGMQSYLQAQAVARKTSVTNVTDNTKPFSFYSDVVALFIPALKS
jgi:hypothetical protein